MSVQALSLLPNEMWTNIIPLLPLLPDRIVLSKLCPTSTTINDVHGAVLPRLLVPLTQYLSKNDLLFSIRMVNRDWKNHTDRLVKNTLLDKNNEAELLPKRFIQSLKLSDSEFPTFCEDMESYLNNNKTTTLRYLHLTGSYPNEDCDIIFKYLEKYGRKVFRLKLQLRTRLESFDSFRQYIWKYLSYFPRIRSAELVPEVISPGPSMFIEYSRFVNLINRGPRERSPHTIARNRFLRNVSISLFGFENGKMHHIGYNEYFLHLFIKSFKNLQRLRLAPHHFYYLEDRRLPNLVELDINIGKHLPFSKLSEFLRGRRIQKLTVKWFPGSLVNVRLGTVGDQHRNEKANFKMWLKLHELQETLTFLHLHFENDFIHDILPTSRIMFVIRQPKLTCLIITNGMIVDYEVFMKSKSLEKIHIILTDEVYYHTPVAIPSNDDVDKIWTIVPSLRILTLEDKITNRRYFWSREIFDFHHNKQ